MNRFMTSILAGAGALALLAAPAKADVELPGTMVWTAYDLGSSGYAEASAIADALQKRFNTRIRIIPAGTSIGRMLPITNGRAGYGFLANETFFAAEGTFDFGVQQWGPQDLRIVLGRPASNGMATARDTGVETISDLKGKRIGYVTGNPSVNVKTDAYLALGGMTRDDVEIVWFGSYNAMRTAVIANQLDSFASVTTSANVREMEASPRGLVWPSMPPDDEEGWAKVNQIVDFLEPYRETQGAAIDAEKGVDLVAYRYPMITTYARQSADEVYNLVKAIDMVFDDFKNTTASTDNWEVRRSGRPPYDAPAHEGTIRYMKEIGAWTDEDQEWHDARMARLERTIEVWDRGVDEFNEWRAQEAKEGRKVDPDEAFPEWWEKFREEELNKPS